MANSLGDALSGLKKPGVGLKALAKNKAKALPSVTVLPARAKATSKK